MGAAIVLVDTTGLITPGFGFQLKLRKVELLNPLHVVALQRGDELEPLLMVIDRQGRHVHRLRVSDSVKPRTAADRALYRARRFAAYFAHAPVLTLRADHLLFLAPPLRRFGLLPPGASDLLNPTSLQGDDWTGHLIGLNNENNHTLGLGLLQGVSNDGRSIRVRTPLRETAGISILQLGEPASLSFRRRVKREA
jgi:polynucleotide 5'-kinase involved in rRNA processing